MDHSPGDGAAPATPQSVAQLSALLESRADEARVAADIATLAAGPRGHHHPEAMARARQHVTEQLTGAGWRVRSVPFQRRWVVGVTDAGGQPGVLGRLRLFRELAAVNLIADRPGSAGGRRILLVAHLDSVACGPGADDNASGVAALLESARLLATLPDPPSVVLAIVDMEELGKVGSAALARQVSFVRDLDLVVCLESVGTFSAEPGTQKVQPLGLLFRDLARRIRARQSRGDFLLAICRSSSAGPAEVISSAGAALSDPLPVYQARDPRPDGRIGRLLTALLPPLMHLDRSDHAPFWSRGVPAMMLTTTAVFRNPHYHRSSDQPHRVNSARVTAVAVAVAAAAATRFGLPSRRRG
ncbi:MAG TPA: M28 family peptidase [Rugosimonospora sp.]|nr:M28 family peptidase [Rugosimonospora sp.]